MWRRHIIVRIVVGWVDEAMLTLLMLLYLLRLNLARRQGRRTELLYLRIMRVSQLHLRLRLQVHKHEIPRQH